MKFTGCRNLLNDWTPRVGGKHLLWCPINYCFIIKGFLSLFVLISVGIIIWLPYPGPNIWPSAKSSRPSGSAHVHEISANLKHVAWFTCSLFLWMHLLWNKLDGRKIQFCIANVISISLRTLNVKIGVWGCLYGLRYLTQVRRHTREILFILRLHEKNIPPVWDTFYSS